MVQYFSLGNFQNWKIWNNFFSDDYEKTLLIMILYTFIYPLKKKISQSLGKNYHNNAINMDQSEIRKYYAFI